MKSIIVLALVLIVPLIGHTRGYGSIDLPLSFVDSAAPKVRHSLEQFLRHESYINNPDRNFWSLQYGIKVRGTNLFVKTLRYSVRSLAAYQFESELYQQLSAKSYMYVDAACSRATLFSNYRFRAEYFRNIRRLEFSGGLGMVKPHTFREIPLVTGTFGYYVGDYYIYVRPTFSYVDGVTKSIFLHTRRYFNKSDFVAMSLLKGVDVGTSRAANAIANTFGSDTWLMRVQFQKKTRRWKFGAGFDHGGIYVRERGDYMRFIGTDITLNYTF